jgi:hypothetical protein
MPKAIYVPYRDSFLQKQFHALRDGSIDLYKNRAWGERGSLYNGTALQPSAAYALAPTAPQQLPAAPAPNDEYLYNIVCEYCQKLLHTATVDRRHIRWCTSHPEYHLYHQKK